MFHSDSYTALCGWASPPAIRNNAIEKHRYNPSLELAFKLADFFGVTIEELFIRNSPEDSAEPEAVQ